MQYIVKAKKTYLKSPLTTTATSVILRNLVDSKDNALAMSDFGDWGVIVIKQGDNIEMIKFDGITVASDGTATLDVATSGRALDPTTPYAGSSTGVAFQSGAEVIVTNDPLTMSRFARLDNNNTFSLVPKSSADPVDDEDLVRKSWVLNNLPAGAVGINRIVVAGLAGETVADGDLVYQKVADGEWYLCDADTASTVENIQLGIAQGAGTDGNAISGGILKYGYDDAQAGGSAGALGYASNTAGEIGTSAGTTEKVVGQFVSATTFLFDPNFYYLLKAGQSASIPTSDEKSALGGSLGTPSSTNKFLTEENVFDSDTDQTQATRNAGVAVGEENITTKRYLIAQSFIPAKTKIRGVNLYKDADTASFTGTVKVALQADSAGSPSGSDLASATITNAEWLKISTGEFSAIFGTEYASLVIGSLYWIVITPSTNDTSNHPNLGTNSAGGYASGSVKYNNTTDGWVAIATIDLYFKTLQGISEQIVKTQSNKVPMPITQRLRDRSYVYSGSIQGDATTGTIQISHGLGYKPTYVKAMCASYFNTQYQHSHGVAKIADNGTVTYNSIWVNYAGTNNANSTSFIMRLGEAGAYQTFTVTNVTEDIVEITYTKSGSPSGIAIQLLIEIFI